jgi:hypothetical protein
MRNVGDQLDLSAPCFHLSCLLRIQEQEATMKAIVGVFKSRSDAERSAAELVPLEIPKARINILTPEVTDKEIAAVPTVAGEQPGVGKALGAVVGGAMGVASEPDSLQRLLVSWSLEWVQCWVLESLQAHCWARLGQWEPARLAQHLKVSSKGCQKTSCSFTKMHCGKAAPLLWLWLKKTMQARFAAPLNSLAPKPSIERGKRGGSAFGMQRRKVHCRWCQF